MVDALRSFGIEVWFDEDNIGAGIIRSIIERELEVSDYFVVILSPDATASKWVNDEVSIAIDLLHEGKIKAIIPITAEKCEPSRFLKIYKIITGPDGERVTVDEAVESVLSVTGINKIFQQPAAIVTSSSDTSNLLPLPDKFIGREEEIRWLNERLISNDPGSLNVAGITGMAGIGKTALVAAWIQQVKHLFKSIIILRVDQENTQSLVERLVRGLIYDGSKLIADTKFGVLLSYVMNALSQFEERNEKALVIFDDVSLDILIDKKLRRIINVLLAGNAKIIFTSRLSLPQWLVQDQLPLQSPNEDTAKQFFIAGLTRFEKQAPTPEESEAIEKIYKLLSGHPLAIQLVVAYLNDTDKPLDAVLEDMQKAQ